MPALFPMQVAPEDYRPGDCVKKFSTPLHITPYVGVITHIIPATCKVWVQWPTNHSQEDPETLIKVNPVVMGLPVALTDRGYSSYEKTRSLKRYGPGLLPRPRFAAVDKMAIRIAHSFATSVISKLINDISKCKSDSMTDVQAYNRIYAKYGTVCSDHIIKNSIGSIYSKSV